MAPSEKSSASAAASPGSLSTPDAFVRMLRHLSMLADAADRERQKQGLEPLKPCLSRKPSTSAVLSAGFHNLKEVIPAAAVFTCVIAIRIVLRAVRLIKTCLAELAKLVTDWGPKHPAAQVGPVTVMYWSLANMLVQLEGLRQDRLIRSKAVSAFIKKYHVSPLVSLRMHRHVRLCLPQHIRPGRAATLQRSAKELMVDILEEFRLPILGAHTFFASLRESYPQLVREVYRKAMDPLLVLVDDHAFRTGEVCTRMYVLISGTGLYTINTPAKRDGSGGGQDQIALPCGQWLSEASLWTNWVHKGDLQVTSDSLFVTIDAAEFARIISTHQTVHTFAATYARKYVEELNQSPQSDLSEAGQGEI